MERDGHRVVDEIIRRDLAKERQASGVGPGPILNKTD
jgi:hypothetical protein